MNFSCYFENFNSWFNSALIITKLVTGDDNQDDTVLIKILIYQTIIFKLHRLEVFCNKVWTSVWMWNSLDSIIEYLSINNRDINTTYNRELRISVRFFIIISYRVRFCYYIKTFSALSEVSIGSRIEFFQINYAFYYLWNISKKKSLRYFDLALDIFSTDVSCIYETWSQLLLCSNFIKILFPHSDKSCYYICS